MPNRVQLSPHRLLGLDTDTFHSNGYIFLAGIDRYKYNKFQKSQELIDTDCACQRKPIDINTLNSWALVIERDKLLYNNRACSIKKAIFGLCVHQPALKHTANPFNQLVGAAFPQQRLHLIFWWVLIDTNTTNSKSHRNWSIRIVHAKENPSIQILSILWIT